MTTPDIAVVLIRLEMKLDQLLKTSSDHETRIRDLETTTQSGKSMAMMIANAVLTALTAVAAGTSVLGG